MAGCLRDRTLLLLYYGGGTNARRNHLAKCKACAERYRQVERDLEAISHVLREKPLPKIAGYRFRRDLARCWPATAALALALVLVWVSVRMWSPSHGLLFKGTNNGEKWSLAEEFPSNLFLMNEALASGVWIHGSGSYNLAAAVLEAERPCEWYDLAALDTAGLSVEDSEISGVLPFATCAEMDPAPSHKKH